MRWIFSESQRVTAVVPLWGLVTFCGEFSRAALSRFYLVVQFLSMLLLTFLFSSAFNSGTFFSNSKTDEFLKVLMTLENFLVFLLVLWAFLANQARFFSCLCIWRSAFVAVPNYNFQLKVALHHLIWIKKLNIYHNKACIM